MTEVMAMRVAVGVSVGVLAVAAVAYAQSEWNELPLAAGVFKESPTEYRADIIEIPLAAFGELEYKLGLKEGDSIVYRWSAALEEPGLLYAEFHGHTERVGDAPGDLMFYRKAAGASERGALVAPFSGIHGWYLRNDSEQPLVVRLEVAGFYELLPQ
jgi:hypothetical protein